MDESNEEGLRQRQKAASSEGNKEDTHKASPTLVVIEFSKKISQETVDWFNAKICAPKDEGGAELSSQKINNESRKTLMLYVSACTDRLLLGAELMELKKPHKDGSLHEISYQHLQLFHNSEDPDKFLTMSEKQRIILHELETIRSEEDSADIPGLSKCKLYKGEAILARFLTEGYIRQIFPLHDKAELELLGKSWYQVLLKRQPIDAIQSYFGDTMAMYFSFLGFYTMALIPPAVIGIFTKFFIAAPSDLDLVIFFCAFNLVWSTLFLEAWKRNCATLSYKWGTIRSEPFEEARAAYYGVLGANKVTDRLEPKYPKWKRSLKFYGVSVPVVLLCLFGAFQVMLWYFYCEGLALQYDREHKAWWTGYMTFLPSVVYALVIIILNALYRKLAKALNDWENHRLESAYENHLITKLVLFDFVNCFLSLFYIAFILHDMKMLRMSLATLLIVQQVVQQFQETVIPYFLGKYRKVKVAKYHKLEKKRSESDDTAGVEEIDKNDQEYIEMQATKDAYLGTLDDYLELFLQFGYVFLFSAVYPAAAFWALLNNVIEIRSDAFKMCRVFQRTFARPTAGIGAWQVCFEALGVIAVVTNCALIGLSPHVKVMLPDHKELDILMLFVFAEHLLLLMKLLIAYVIPDEPGWVQTAIQRLEFQAKKAWRNQRYQEAQKMLHEKGSHHHITVHKDKTV